MLSTGSAPGEQQGDYFDIKKFETLLDQLESSKRQQQKETLSAPSPALS